MDWMRIQTLQALISGRWEPPVLMTLQRGPMRSARLREAISPRPSYRALSRTVQALQKKGFIERVEGIGPDRRMKVLYQLTDEGKVIVDLLAHVDDWALIHSGDLPTAYPAGPNRPDAPDDGAALTGAGPDGSERTGPTRPPESGPEPEGGTAG